MIPPELPLLSQAELRNMAAWHLVDLLEMGLVQEVDSAPLEVLTPRDRMQYIQESKTFKSVPMLEEARWRSVDVEGAAAGATALPQDLEVITDMVMLLNLMEVAPSAILLRVSVILLTLIFLAASPFERLVAYFQVQQAFQFARGVLLGIPRSDGSSLIKLSNICDDVFRQGWREYQVLCAGVVIDDPPKIFHGNFLSYFDPKRLKRVGLWPVFINPFRLSTDDWRSLQDTEPYSGVPLAEGLTTIRRDVPDINVSVKKGVRLLREHVVEAFGKLPGASADRATLLCPPQEKNTLVRPTDVTTPLNWILKPSPLTTFAEHLDWAGADAFVLAFRQTLAVTLTNAQRPTEGELPVIEWPDPPPFQCVPMMLAPNVLMNATQYRQSTDRERVETLAQLELWASTTLPSESPTTSFIRQAKHEVNDHKNRTTRTDEAEYSDSVHERTGKSASHR
ncbi:MAG: LOW QUALITY PROTEIN: hypothetical protein KVP17_004355 [Porospora cf. gigantea B]|uniref:uncharacterized protein n=1 Tax=Porospora cf. gigantea B TaxID=2853592 RepID=UPI0035717BF8|nr:MAG: LOW QUALITY PROTEIN: hypothetical protein KVP17_004355 [Porospora cf. gigantea B]